MERVVNGCDEQSLQHSLTNSQWGYRAVFDQVAREAGAGLGGRAESASLSDESGFAKKGAPNSSMPKSPGEAIWRSRTRHSAQVLTQRPSVH